MKLSQEECFGPLLPVTFVNNTEEAVTLANESQYGLGASIWTSNNNKGIDLAKKLQVGMVWINDVNIAFPEAPWGGKKNSGIGIALSDDAIYEYVNKKHISSDESKEEKRIGWYPY
jgi:betaine-aldehyde dehydrogenase